MINIALCYSSVHNFKEAKKYVDLALGSCGAACTSDVKIQAEFARGMIAFRLKNTDEAEQNFLRSNRVAKDVGDARLCFDNAAMLSRIYIGKGQLKGRENFERSRSAYTVN